jgi:hypothetical protein
MSSDQISSRLNSIANPDQKASRLLGSRHKQNDGASPEPSDITSNNEYGKAASKKKQEEEQRRALAYKQLIYG